MSKIMKKFGQFSQALGEKMGSTQKTETSEEFKRLCQDTQARHDSLRAILLPLEGYWKNISKVIEKMPVLEGLGKGMSDYGSILSSDSPYGQTLLQTSAAQKELSYHRENLATELLHGYLRALKDAGETHKEYDKLASKLENRRLDFDAKLNKMQKAKKESSAIEEECREAREKYEETLEAITEKMLELNSKDEEHHASLLQFIELQANYFAACSKTLETLQSQLASRPTRETTVDATNKILGSKVGSSASINRLSSRPVSNVQVIPLANLPPQNDGQQSQYSGAPLQNPAFATQMTNQITSQPVSVQKSIIPVRPGSSHSQLPPQPKQVRATFDFDPENPNELSIRVGDIITITEEVDAGWWIGIIQGSGKKGMFPANYTEPHVAELLMPRPKLSNSSLNDLNRLSNNAPIQKYASNSSLGAGDYNHRSSGNGRPVLNNGLGDRVSSSTQPPRVVSESYTSAGLCGTCGCSDYAPHAFKQNTCNNCYHSH